MVSSAYMAKLAEEAARYKKLLDFMETVSIPDPQELKFAAVAWNKISTNVDVFCSVVTRVQGEREGCYENLKPLMNDCRSTIEDEISGIRDKVSNPAIREYLADFKTGAGEEEPVESPKKEDGPNYNSFGVHIRDLRRSFLKSGLPKYQLAAKKKKNNIYNEDYPYDHDHSKCIESQMRYLDAPSAAYDDLPYRKIFPTLPELPVPEPATKEKVEVEDVGGKGKGKEEVKEKEKEKALPLTSPKYALEHAKLNKETGSYPAAPKWDKKDLPF